MAARVSIAAPISAMPPKTPTAMPRKRRTGRAQHHFHSLVVVTARYHMPRSLREFSAVMPDVTLIAYPVEQSGIDLPAGGGIRAPLQLLHREYVKYLASLVMTSLTTA